MVITPPSELKYDAVCEFKRFSNLTVCLITLMSELLHSVFQPSQCKILLYIIYRFIHPLNLDLR